MSNRESAIKRLHSDKSLFECAIKCETHELRTSRDPFTDDGDINAP